MLICTILKLCKLKKVREAGTVHCWLTKIQLSHSHELMPTPAPCNLTFTQITAARACHLKLHTQRSSQIWKFGMRGPPLGKPSLKQQDEVFCAPTI